MRILVDTHLLLWWVAGSRLPGKSGDLIRDPSNEVYVSAASVWEVAIKTRLGRLEVDPSAFASALTAGGFGELPVTSRHAAVVAGLPDHHRDPFDRMLVAQALTEPMRLLTHDRALASYGDAILLAG
ncbi:MAG: type II toxin-antitoxin system VapC family toxin [Pseudomonadota bacterium]